MYSKKHMKPYCTASPHCVMLLPCYANKGASPLASPPLASLSCTMESVHPETQKDSEKDHECQEDQETHEVRAGEKEIHGDGGESQADRGQGAEKDREKTQDEREEECEGDEEQEQQVVCIACGLNQPLAVCYLIGSGHHRCRACNNLEARISRMITSDQEVGKQWKQLSTDERRDFMRKNWSTQRGDLVVQVKETIKISQRKKKPRVVQ